MMQAPALFWIVCTWIILVCPVKKIKAKMMFKILKGDAPAYLQNLFSASGTGHDLRNSEIKLNLPKP